VAVALVVLIVLPQRLRGLHIQVVAVAVLVNSAGQMGQQAAAAS